MARIVQKFGGTSVADIARLENVALKVKKEVALGHQVAVVVSAMAGVTNQLVGYARSLAGSLVTPEYDVVASAGEQITSGLLALALSQIGVQARSFMGWQLPIVTDNCAANARILRVQTEHLEACWNQNMVPVIAGFQGVTDSGRITTLGRGGSDTTAVAVAAAVKADWCDIYTDVDGVYSADPRLVPQARRLDIISYDEMFELASHGAKVLQMRSVETAMEHAVKVRVLSSFQEGGGTMVVPVLPSDVSVIRGIAHQRGQALIHLREVRQAPQQLEAILAALRDKLSHVDIFSAGVSSRGDLNIGLPLGDVPMALSVIENRQETIGYQDLTVDMSMSSIALVGSYRHLSNSEKQRILKLLSAYQIPVVFVAASPLKILIFVPEEKLEEAVCLLHSEYFPLREVA
jgi:aspartate kinase